MADIDKLIDAVEACANEECGACPFYRNGIPNAQECRNWLADRVMDELEYLKETKPSREVIPCENCEYWDKDSGLTARACSVQKRITKRHDWCSNARKVKRDG